MDIKKCKVGTRVQFKGTIIDGLNDITSVHVRTDDGSTKYISPENLEPATPHYDPKRKFRKGDIAKVDYKGRVRNTVIPEGTEVEVLKDECDPYHIKVKVERHIDSDGWMFVNVDHLVLIKPIEEMEKEEPYLVDTGAVKRRDGGIIMCFSYGKYGRDNADSMAQKVCDELNREYKKIKNS